MRTLLFAFLAVDLFAATHNVTTSSNIQTTINGATAGDTLVFADGTYEGDWSINKKLTLRAANPGKAVLDGENSRDWGLTLTGNEIVVDGFEIKRYRVTTTAYEMSGGIHFNSTSMSDCEIRNCRIHDCYDKAIHVKGYDHTIENCEIYKIGDHREAMGVYLEYCGNAKVQNNLFYLIKKECVRIRADKSVGNNQVLSNCMFMAQMAVAINDGVIGAKILNNYAYQCVSAFYAKRSAPAVRMVLAHNTAKDCFRACVLMSDNGDPSLANFAIWNNVFLPKYAQYAIRYDPQYTNTAQLYIDGNCYVTYDGRGWLIGRNWIESPPSGWYDLAAIQSGTVWEDAGLEVDESLFVGGLTGPTRATAFGSQVGSSVVEPPVAMTLLDLTAIRTNGNNVDPNQITKTTDRKAHTRWRSGAWEGTADPTKYIDYRIGSGAVSWNMVFFIPFEHDVLSNIQDFRILVSANPTTYNADQWQVLLDSETDSTANMHWFDVGAQTAQYIRFEMKSNWSGKSQPGYIANEYSFAEFLVGRLAEAATEVVTTPSVPSGTTSGESGEEYEYTIGGSSSSLGHSVEYSVDFGDNSGYSAWSSSTTVSHTWANAGTYQVRVQARCATHPAVTSEWSSALTVAISTVVPPPETVSVPMVPNGAVFGENGTSYTYTTGGSTCSEDGHTVEYQFDWGDGTTSTYAASTSASHTWTTDGNWPVRARARCAINADVVSGWSPSTVMVIYTTTTEEHELQGTVSIPTGETNGTAGTVYTYTTGGITCTGNHTIEYRFAWGDLSGWSAWSSSTSQSHAWNVATVYNVQAQARCAVNPLLITGFTDPLHVTITGSTAIVEEISVPNAPSGSSTGDVDTGYTFTLSGATSSVGHSVEYRVNWGDGTPVTDWASTTSLTHSWSTTGAFLITCQARCTTDTDVVSAWSDNHTITISTTVPPTNAWTAPQRSGIFYAYTTNDTYIDQIETLTLQYDDASDFSDPTTLNFTLSDMATTYGTKLKVPLDAWLREAANGTYYLRSRFVHFDGRTSNWSATLILIRNWSTPSAPATVWLSSTETE